MMLFPPIPYPHFHLFSSHKPSTTNPQYFHHKYPCIQIHSSKDLQLLYLERDQKRDGFHAVVAAVHDAIFPHSFPHLHLFFPAANPPRPQYFHYIYPCIQIHSSNDQQLLYLERDQKRDGFHAVVAAVHVIAHEQVVRVRRLTPDLK